MYRKEVGGNPSREEWIDFAKGVCITLVIFCHAYSWPGIRYYVYMFHLPVFFMTAGYLYKKRAVKDEIKRSFMALIRPYFLTCILIVAGSLVIDHERPVHIITSMLLCYSFDKNNYFFSAGAVWFLGCMFCSRILFSLLMKNSNIKLVILLSSMMAVMGMVLSTLAYLPYSLDVAMVTQFFMVLGSYYHLNEKRLDRLTERRAAVISVAAAALLFGLLENRLGSGYFNLAGRNYPFYVLSVLFNTVISLVMLQLCRKICLCDRFGKLTGCMAYMGRNSLLVLCIHSIEDRWTSRFRTGTLLDIGLFLAKYSSIAVMVILLNHIGRKKVISAGGVK